MAEESLSSEPQIKDEPEELPFHIVVVKSEDDECEPDSAHDSEAPPPERRPDSADGSKRRHDSADGSERRPLSCSDCSRTFRCNSELQVHLLRHAEHKPFVCSLCDRGFVRKSDLTRHRTRAHHVCPVCSERLQNKPGLDQHLQSHVEEGSLEPNSHLVRETVRAFSCEECSATFRWHSHLQNHVLSLHRGQRPHLCSDCGRSFGFRSQLYSHMLGHSGARPHICPICDKGFTLKSTLNQHVKTHGSEKPFVCSVCDKSSVRKKDVTWHEAVVHHVCPVCAQRFSHRARLGEHLQEHAAVGALDSASALFRAIARPFSCSECGKTFPKNSELKRHMTVHQG